MILATLFVTLCAGDVCETHALTSYQGDTLALVLRECDSLVLQLPADIKPVCRVAWNKEST